MSCEDREGSVYIDQEEWHRSGSPAYNGKRSVNPAAVARELPMLGRAPTPPVSRFRQTQARRERDESGTSLPEHILDVIELEASQARKNHEAARKRRLVARQDRSREERNRNENFFDRDGFLKESPIPEPASIGTADRLNSS